MPGMLRAARAKFSSTVGPSMISTEPQPSLSRRLTSAAVFASASFAVSSTISLPSACLAESAVLSARRRTFFCSENSWLRTTGPKITAPPRNCGERRLPWRARPVPFWRHGFLVVPWTSLMPLVLCVPARRLASCQLTMRARMSRRTGRPNTASARSMLPTSLLSRLVMASFMSGSPRPAPRRQQPARRRARQVLGRLAFHRVLDQHVAAIGAGHRALDHDEAALAIGGDDAQILRGHALVAVMAGHLLVLEDLAGILALAGRAVAAVRDRDAVARAQAAEIVPPHDAGEAAALGRAGDVDELPGEEMRRRQLDADLEQRVLGHAELDELALRLDLRLGVVAAHGLGHVLDLGLADAELDGGVAVLLLGPHGSAPQSLISTSTPAARSSFISASTVCGVGSTMSSTRLCVRISNCSRDFLSTCGERSTVNFSILVGSGIGPRTRAPVRLAVLTISLVD